MTGYRPTGVPGSAGSEIRNRPSCHAITTGKPNPHNGHALRRGRRPS
jgi:hypothetical protein